MTLILMETVLSPYCHNYMVKKLKLVIISLKIGKKRVIIGIQWMLMFVIANRPTVGYCYYWNTVDANVCDMLIGLLWDTVIIGIQWMLMFVIC